MVFQQSESFPGDGNNRTEIDHLYRVGTGAANPLKPGETTTIQSLNNTFSTWDFIWHGLYNIVLSFVT
jgi:hypothetical protein